MQRFEQRALTARVAHLERSIEGADAPAVASILATGGVDAALLDAAITLKQAAGQVNVLIHAVGILLALPNLLGPGETVQLVSLGAVTPGRSTGDEPSSRRVQVRPVAGGAETIRQNAVFKDFSIWLRQSRRKIAISM